MILFRSVIHEEVEFFRFTPIGAFYKHISDICYVCKKPTISKNVIRMGLGLEG